MWPECRYKNQQEFSPFSLSNLKTPYISYPKATSILFMNLDNQTKGHVGWITILKKLGYDFGWKMLAVGSFFRRLFLKCSVGDSLLGPVEA